MKLKWNKEYKKNNKERPDSYSIEHPFNIRLHHHIYYDKDEWLFSCRDLDMHQVQLHTKDIDVAEEKALAIIKKHIDDLNSRYAKLLNMEE